MGQSLQHEAQNFRNKYRKLREKFIKEIQPKIEEIDPNEERHWDDLIYGWALAQGIPVDDAYEFGWRLAGEIAEAYPNPIR